MASIDSPAFFSWNVKSAQFSFMRSRNDIQSSACSGGGMSSHLFSMFASVGLEMAWVEAAMRETIDTGFRRAASEKERRRAAVPETRSILSRPSQKCIGRDRLTAVQFNWQLDGRVTPVVVRMGSRSMD